MRYYLTTTQRDPGFYRADGSIVRPSLQYVKRKVIRSLNSEGQLIETCVVGDPPENLGVWMVDDLVEAIKALQALKVYPFEDKNSARTHAKKLGLKTFKYLPAPVV